MPTSTIWRRSENPFKSRGGSPVRPSAECIERLSPEPSLEPHSPDDPPLLPHTAQESGYPLRGLGLSDTGFGESPEAAVQPDHLYYDQDGAAHVGARIVSGATSEIGHSIPDPQEWSSRVRNIQQDPRQPPGKGHTRSGSTIDDLATAAIATSPALVNASPHFISNGSPYTTTRPSTSYVHRYSHDEAANGPPAKRFKSDRIPNLEWSPQAERPRTSGGRNNPAEVDHEDALLLLGLKTEVNFKTHTPLLDSTPIQVRAHSFSTTQRPLKAWNSQGGPTAQIHQTLGIGSRNFGPSEDKSKQAEQTILDHRRDSYQGSSVRQEKTVEIRSSDSMKPEATSPHAADTSLKPIAEEPPPAVTEAPKKQRRVKPEVQAEVCAACQRLQLEPTADEEDSSTMWISCDACNRWFHAQCAGFKTKAEARSVDKYTCKDCEPVHGPTTFVRKSSRPRTAIDYAGLNQGLVKSSVETSSHHYIQPLKEGKITLSPDDFARIRPELLTMEFMESFEGMKRPFVVPAAWNPRFGVKRTATESYLDTSTDEAPYTLLNSEGAPAGPEPPPSSEVDEEEVIDCDQDLLDMVIPRNLTVRRVAELYGPDEPVPVIDVKSQETKGQFTLRQWADYYELQGDKPIRNVISLEVSHSPLGRLIRRPKVVRDLDLEDHVWEADNDTRTKKRPVQFYCLMSVADSYTDFHIDFGGSSVYYHILKGTKTFFFIPPEDRYLKKYEDWCNSDSQNETWLGDLCGGNCTRVDLHEGDTAFIPAGWIHSVWTPEDSLVIGGNFLTRLDYELQFKVANIEKSTKVAPKFRYPYFQKVMWYALIKYLEEDPLSPEVLEDFRSDPDYTYLRADPIWHEIDDLEDATEPGHPAYNCRYYPKSEVSGWPSLRDFLYRTARIDAGLPVADITKKQIEAVRASIPKGHGDPLTMIKLFAIWIAWKTGNVAVPEWVHSDGGPEPEKVEKIKKPETFRLPGERTSSRKIAQAQAQAQGQPPLQPQTPTPPAKPSKGNGLRVACEPCRKRRIKCRHKSGSETPRPTPEIRPRSFSNAMASALTNGTVEDNIDPRLDSLGNNSEVNQSDPNSASKKSRSKACEECRKSKRRCVHDQFGRIDPAKVAEPSKPRGSTTAKRARPSDESGQNKRARTDVDSLDDLIDPALMSADVSQMINEAAEEDFHTPRPILNEVEAEATGGDKKPAADYDSAAPDDGYSMPVDPALEAMTAIVDGPMTIKSEVDQADKNTLMDSAVADSISSKQDAFSTPGPANLPSSVDGDLSGAINSTGSRQSSRQPKQVQRYTPEDKRSPSKPCPKPARNDRRASSAASAQTIVTSVKSRRSSSNTSGTTHQIAGIMTSRRSASREATARPISRGSTGGESDMGADERFARELQAAENGLRRRTSMRA